MSIIAYKNRIGAADEYNPCYDRQTLVLTNNTISIRGFLGLISVMKSENSTLLLGTVLNEAGLISCHQIEVALREQIYNQDLRIGEILALHGWVKQETADFFAEDWFSHARGYQRNPLGFYLISAGLLNDQQLDYILKEQARTGMRIGALAVLQGWVKKPTIDFFIKYLEPDELNASPFKRGKAVSSDSSESSDNNSSLWLDPNQTRIHVPQPVRQSHHDADDDVPWVG